MINNRISGVGLLALISNATSQNNPRPNSQSTAPKSGVSSSTSTSTSSRTNGTRTRVNLGNGTVSSRVTKPQHKRAPVTSKKTQNKKPDPKPSPITTTDLFLLGEGAKMIRIQNGRIHQHLGNRFICNIGGDPTKFKIVDDKIVNSEGEFVYDIAKGCILKRNRSGVVPTLLTGDATNLTSSSSSSTNPRTTNSGVVVQVFSGRNLVNRMDSATTASNTEITVSGSNLSATGTRIPSDRSTGPFGDDDTDTEGEDIDIDTSDDDDDDDDDLDEEARSAIGVIGGWINDDSDDDDEDDDDSTSFVTDHYRSATMATIGDVIGQLQQTEEARMMDQFYQRHVQETIARSNASIDKSKIQLPPLLSTGEPKTTDDAKQCTICCDNEKSAILVPCGHTGYCVPCMRRLVETSKPICPLCRKPITQVMRIFAN